MLRAPASIREQVVIHLRQAITTRQLTPGEPLVERTLCEATTASRATVREALRQLESEGLVVTDPGRGTFVASMSASEAAQLYEVRAALEGLACRLFVTNADPTNRAELTDVVAQLADTVNRPDEMLALKSDLYRILFEGAGNQELGRIVETLRRRITLVRVNSLSIAGRPQASLAEIQAVVDAIERGDADEAERLAIEHIRNAAAAVFAAGDSWLVEPTLSEASVSS